MPVSIKVVFASAVCWMLTSLGVAPSLASDAPLDRATLRGLKTLRVVIDLGAELRQAGIARADLAAQVQRRLERAGIAVDANAVDFVGLKITAAQNKNTPYALCLELGIYQTVTLKRDPTITTSTLTWSAESVLLTPRKLLQDALTTTIDQLADQFVSAFRGANPGP